MEKKLSLKDFLFNENKLRKIASEIKNHHKGFKEKKFINDCIREFPQLELKQRIRHISITLNKYLPSDYRVSVNLLLESLPPPNDETKTDNDFGDFIYAPYADFIALYGCRRAELKFSLQALKEITKRFSAEDAIRYFINAYPKETLTELSEWSKDANYHVRRLCSEGTRPKLPWAQKISLPVEAAMPILDNLYSDKTRYVTRSVANHMNDLAKTNPRLTIDTLKRWKKSGKQSKEEMEYIVKHSLRTLIKNGDSDALMLVGILNDLPVKVTNFALVNRDLKIGEFLEFSCRIAASDSGSAIVDYIIWFQAKDKKLGKKVFKLKTLKLTANHPVFIRKKYNLRPGMTTRKLYPGRHTLALQINGKILAQKDFMLKI